MEEEVEVVEEVAVAEVAEVEEEEAAAEQPLQVEEPTQMQSYWEENPNTLKETDETSIDSSRTLSPIST